MVTWHTVELGVLHLATLTNSLPRLLERLKKPSAGRMAQDIVKEIESVDTSPLAWAVQASQGLVRQGNSFHGHLAPGAGPEGAVGAAA